MYKGILFFNFFLSFLNVPFVLLLMSFLLLYNFWFSRQGHSVAQIGLQNSQRPFSQHLSAGLQGYDVVLDFFFFQIPFLKNVSFSSSLYIGHVKAAIPSCNIGCQWDYSGLFPIINKFPIDGRLFKYSDSIITLQSWMLLAGIIS